MVTTERRVRIASRGSQLALWQTDQVRAQLIALHPGLEVEVEVVQTKGDKILDVPLAKIGDKGLFTKEVDEALLEGRADLAVHSLKDVPTRLPDGLRMAAITRREDARDVLVGPNGKAVSLMGLPQGSRVGTSSLRRRAQLRRLRPDLEVADLRGNLNTRLAKLDAGEYAAIVLAAAGMIRLGWSDRISEVLEPSDWLPAVGQGALGIIARTDDASTGALLEGLHDQETSACVEAERAFLRALEGGCQVPIGALAQVREGTVYIEGLVADLEGTTILRDTAQGRASEAGEVGLELARMLLERGAREILAEIRRRGDVPGVPAP